MQPKTFITCNENLGISKGESFFHDISYTSKIAIKKADPLHRYISYFDGEPIFILESMMETFIQKKDIIVIEEER